MDYSRPDCDSFPPYDARPSPPTQSMADLVLAVLTSKTSGAQAARAAGLTEAELVQWTHRFVEAGAVGLRSGGLPKLTPAQAVDLAASNEALRERLCEKHAQLELWRTVAGGVLVPSATLR